MFPFHRVALSRADMIYMGLGTPGFSIAITDPSPDSFSQVLKSDLAMVMVRFSSGAHLRLDTCSFRTGATSPRVVGVNGAFWLMRQPNPRVSGVIRRCLIEGRNLSLYVFPWLPIPHWAEFRVFFRKGALGGTSQRYVDGFFPQIAQNEAAIRAALDEFVTAIMPRLKSGDVVMDVVAEPALHAGFRIRILNLDVLNHRTDTGLFSMDEDSNFDGTFRFRREMSAADVAEQTLVPIVMARPAPQDAAQPTVPTPIPASEDDAWRI
ncbi:MAG: hypothetical protein ACRCS3_09040 [Paracoccaceae bacterium]